MLSVIGYVVKGRVCHVMFWIVPTNYEGCAFLSRHTSITYFQSTHRSRIFNRHIDHVFSYFQSTRRSRPSLMETNGPPFQGRQTFPITVMHGSNCNTCRVHSWMYMHCYVMHWGSRLLTYWGDRLFSVLTIRCCRNRFYLCMSYLFNTQIKLTMAKTQRNSQLCTVGWQGFRVHHTPIRSTHALAQVYALG